MAYSDLSEFREHRTRDELNQLLNHGHITPISKGSTGELVDTNSPGWTRDRLIKVVTQAGDSVRRSSGIPACDDSAATFHFNGPDEFHVERFNGARGAGATHER